MNIQSESFASFPPSDGLRLSLISEEASTVSSSSQHVILVANKAIFMTHCTGWRHPEGPRRVEVIEEALIAGNLMNSQNWIVPRAATVEEISLCHSLSYFNELQRQISHLEASGVKSAPFDSVPGSDDVAGDFQISPQTLQVSLYAAGAPLTAIEYILNRDHATHRAFCIVRPPGHHAHRETGSGFCVFNNVAIAAKYLTKHLGFERVLIVDWDAHQGDGTQELTESDPQIFYFSTHRDTKKGRGFYPGPRWGGVHERGKGRGLGTVLNCPVYGPKENCRRSILEAFRSGLVPAMDEYKPDFVLISCGFDAHENDPIVGLGLKDEDYQEMTLICVRIAEKYAQGRIVSVLEGGYDLRALASAAVVHVEALSSVT